MNEGEDAGEEKRRGRRGEEEEEKKWGVYENVSQLFSRPSLKRGRIFFKKKKTEKKKN